MKLILLAVRGSCLVLMLVAAFVAGWLTSASSPGPKRTPIKFSASGSIFVPQGFAIALVSRDLTNQGFIPGDRVDVLVQNDGRWTPLVIDVLVAREDWQTVALLVRHEEALLFHKARMNDVPLQYRTTLAPQ